MGADEGGDREAYASAARLPPMGICRMVRRSRGPVPSFRGEQAAPTYNPVGAAIPRRPAWTRWPLRVLFDGSRFRFRLPTVFPGEEERRPENDGER